VKRKKGGLTREGGREGLFSRGGFRLVADEHIKGKKIIMRSSGRSHKGTACQSIWKKISKKRRKKKKARRNFYLR